MDNEPNENKGNMVVMRQSAGEDLIHVGAGFVDVVTTKFGERPVIHLRPNGAARTEKGQHILIFAGKAMQQLPEEITKYGDVDSKKPQYVAYAGDVPVGSGWLKRGKKSFLSVVLNKPVNSDRLTLFPRAPAAE
ncbi:MAG: hypothetical protein WAW23_00710 [Candidatus Methanoperedens sp.]